MAWTVSALFSEQFVTVVPPQMTREHMQFGSTADAMYQSLNLMSMHRPDLVAVFGADHIYRMDVRQMVLCFDAFNSQWPIFSSHYQGPTARVIRGELDKVLLGAATIRNSLLLPRGVPRRRRLFRIGKAPACRRRHTAAKDATRTVPIRPTWTPPC